MADRSIFRLRDIKQSIVQIRTLLDGKTFEEMYRDAVVRAAFERFLEIISEASRRIPPEWKTEHAVIPWRQVGDLRNHLRHAYHRVNLEALWSIYKNDLGPLEIAVDAILDARDLDEGTSG